MRARVCVLSASVTPTPRRRVGGGFSGAALLGGIARAADGAEEPTDQLLDAYRRRRRRRACRCSLESATAEQYQFTVQVITY